MSSHSALSHSVSRYKTEYAPFGVVPAAAPVDGDLHVIVSESLGAGHTSSGYKGAFLKQSGLHRAVVTCGYMEGGDYPVSIMITMIYTLDLFNIHCTATYSIHNIFTNS